MLSTRRPEERVGRRPVDGPVGANADASSSFTARRTSCGWSDIHCGRLPRHWDIDSRRLWRSLATRAAALRHLAYHDGGMLFGRQPEDLADFLTLRTDGHDEFELQGQAMSVHAQMQLGGQSSPAATDMIISTLFFWAAACW